MIQLFLQPAGVLRYGFIYFMMDERSLVYPGAPIRCTIRVFSTVLGVVVYGVTGPLMHSPRVFVEVVKVC